MESILAKALGQDATQLAAGERQQLLARLLARLAHEIRNPLSSLHIHVQLLEEDLAQSSKTLLEKTAPRLDIIHAELHRLENIVKQYLQLSRTIASHVVQLMRPEASVRGIEIQLDCAPDLPVLKADSGHLTQALLNLIINSLQAVERNGRVHIQISRDPEWLVAQVADTGPGIPSDKLATIFEPYYTTKNDGTGLGLWIAQQIASAHEGHLTAANLPAGGAVFTLRLPVKGEEATGG
jgi:two-component system sensor histidine kinase HydH